MEVSTEEKAVHIKNNISSFLNEDFFPRLEEMFDKHDTGNKILRFNSLDVCVSTQDWENKIELEEELLKKIERKISNADSVVLNSGSRNGSGILYNQESENYCSDNSGSFSKKASEIPRKISPDENYRSTFLFFLKNGFLPWYGRKNYLDEITKPEEWRKNLEDPVFIKALIQSLKDSHQVLYRFVLQFSDEVITDFLFAFKPDLIINKAGFLSYLEKSETNYRNLFLQLILKHFIGMNKKHLLEGWMNMFWFKMNACAKRSEYNTELFIKDLSDDLSRFMGQETLKDIVPFYSKEFVFKLEKQLSEINVSRGKSKPGELSIHLENIPTIFFQEFLQKGMEKEPPYFETKNNSLMVQNAGLVLFHPFLSAFFKKFGWLNQEGKIKQEYLLYTIQALHYCATGNDSFFEGHMLLEKYLCGAPLNLPLPVKSLLDEEVKNETEALLKHIVSGWPALKNTSLEGLRQMFVHRDGKLIKRDEGYKLIVERKAQDVLLDRLPWNISIVKLPWTEDLLFVDW